jgi:hypothetical protein
LLIANWREGRCVQAGVLDLADAVLDPGVSAVAGFEERQLPDVCVGGDSLVAEPVAFLERIQLGSGVGSFATDDDSHVGRPGPGSGVLAGLPACGQSLRGAFAAPVGGVQAGDLGQDRGDLGDLCAIA